MPAVERRLFRLGLVLAVGGCLAAWFLYGRRASLSYAAGAALAGINLLWLRATMGSIFHETVKRSKIKVLGGFFLRLLLIPLCLYAMIRFLFLDVIAAVAGFVVFVGSTLIEGILEAFGIHSK